MGANMIEVETVEAYGRTFVKGNVPEINAIRCMACRQCLNLCKKLGPNVFEIVDGVSKPVREKDCIGDGACMLACPTKAIFLMSRDEQTSPPQAV